MGLKIQDERTLLDRLCGRRFRASSIPLLHDPSLLDYNAHYLSVTYKLQSEGEEPDSYTMVTCQRDIHTRQPPLDYKKVWLKKYLDLFLKVEDRPWFLINGDTNLLSRMKFTGADLKRLQGRDVAFYFYEPLFQRTIGSDRCPAFSDANSQVYFPELDWLQDFLYNHGGNIQASVYVCDYMLADHLRSRNLHLNLKVRTWDIFLADLCRSLVEKEIDRDEKFRENGFPFSVQVKKKFICPNFRYEGVRELVVGFLKGHSFAQDGHISFFHRHDRNHFLNELPFDPQTLSFWEGIQRGLTEMQEELPLVLDSKNSKALAPQGFSLPDADGTSNIRSGYEFFSWYSDSFLSIVNETRYGTLYGEISEKTFLPILYMRPFVVVSAPFMLRYLKSMGFETFGDIWDESYDEFEDHGERMQALLGLLEKILSQPLEDLQKILLKLKPRLERNRTHLLENLLPQMHDFIKKENGMNHD